MRVGVGGAPPLITQHSALITSYVARRVAQLAPLLLAPAMDSQMWDHPATQANLRLLAERGAEFLGSEFAILCGAMSWVSERNLVAALMTMKTPEECRAFLKDLCTPAELQAMADRFMYLPLLGLVLAFDSGCHDLIEGGLHAVELELAHEFEDLCSFHQMVLLRLS